MATTNLSDIKVEGISPNFLTTHRIYDQRVINKAKAWHDKLTMGYTRIRPVSDRDVVEMYLTIVNEKKA